MKTSVNVLPSPYHRVRAEVPLCSIHVAVSDVSAFRAAGFSITSHCHVAVEITRQRHAPILFFARYADTEQLMNRPTLAMIGLCALTAASASPPIATSLSNSYHVFTRSLDLDDSGVGEIPSRFRWSVETCTVTVGPQGHVVHDSRVMLRLYDPEQNFTALTAQMDLNTAENLQRQLAELIALKRKNPSFQRTPKLYESDMIPVGRITGVDGNGKVTVELKPKKSAP